MSVNRSIAVLNGTGNQGSNVIESLLRIKSNDDNIVYNIIGLTRDPLSSKCSKLLVKFKNISSKYSVTFIKCDIHSQKDLISIFSSYKIWGVYCVTYAPFNGTNSEINDGKICIDAAIKCNISYFIFASVVAVNTALNNINHINSKKVLEEYLINKVKENKDNIFVDGWTILKTTFYMENLFTYNIPKNGYLPIPVMKPNTKFAIVSVQNIGDIAAAHFNGNINCIQNNHKYDCIGDDICGEEMAKILSAISNSNVKHDNSLGLLYFLEKLGVNIAVDLIAMFKWYDMGGVHGNMKKCYIDLPNKMINFKQFAEQNFKNKNLNESNTRKIIKYSSAIMALGAAAYGVWYYKNKNKYVFK